MHPDDLAVDRFAAAMKAKLAKKRDEGRGGWDGPTCTAVFLSQRLREHVEKDDPLDVGNIAMMLHQRGERIEPAVQDREALIAATVEMAAQAAYQWWDDDDAKDLRGHIRAVAAQPQTDALEAVRREARAEGMRMAADLFTGSDLWEEAGIRGWILAAVQTAADSVLPPDRFNEGTSAAYEAVSDAAREDR